MTLLNFWRENFPLNKDFFQLPQEDLQEILWERNIHSSILDIGCGKWLLLKQLENIGFTNLSGCDISELAIFSAKEKCKKATLFIMNWENDLLWWVYDIVFMHLSLPFIQNKKHILQEIAKSSDTLIVTVPIMESDNWKEYIKPHITIEQSQLVRLLQGVFKEVQLFKKYKISSNEYPVATYICYTGNFAWKNIPQF